MLSNFFKLVLSGEKKFDIRTKNIEYKKGDIIRFKEYIDEQYTGNVYVTEITYITECAQKKGNIIIGFK